MARVPFEEMYNTFLRCLLKEDFREDRAALCAKLFAEATRDGISSHGLYRFPSFIRQIRDGLIDIHAEPRHDGSFGAIERWDGRNGPGNLNAHDSMNRAIHLARQNGLGCVALRNTNHWMRAGSYGWQAADAGCIGICWTNTMPLMPPWGATDPHVGNNPLVIAVPRPKGHVVLDMAMSQFSFGSLGLYRHRKELLPVNGGYDSSGNLTRDPAAIETSCRPLPIGYWKGSGLALMLDIVVTLLSGGLSTCQIGKQDNEHSVSQAFIAFDTAKLAPHHVSEEIVNEIIDDLHSATPTAENGKVLYPGERVLLARRENMEKGIPVDPGFWQQVKAL